MGGAPRAARPGLPLRLHLVVQGANGRRPGDDCGGVHGTGRTGCRVTPRPLPGHGRLVQGVRCPRGKPSGADVPVRPTTGRSLATRFCLGQVPDRRPVARMGTTMGTVVEQPGSCPQKKETASLYPLSGCSARGGPPTGLCMGQCIDPLGQKRLIHRKLPPLLLPLCFYKRNKEEDRDNRNLPGHRFFVMEVRGKPVERARWVAGIGAGRGQAEKTGEKGTGRTRYAGVGQGRERLCKAPRRPLPGFRGCFQGGADRRRRRGPEDRCVRTTRGGVWRDVRGRTLRGLCPRSTSAACPGRTRWPPSRG